ncbi:hypothetical protein F5887DRAFT_3062 [Amanita rubescens]|nr:hypothetical protein F5887DRAFT_3062 [Amanita rubescens]
MLYLLRNNALSDSGIKYPREARKLMFRLISKVNIMPRCLGMTGIRTEMDLIALDVGDFGRVLEGEHNGQQVALTALHKARHDDDLLRKDFHRQALTWRSVIHSFIHPLLGIFEHSSQLFLVSPLMRNGTLTQWRKDKTRSIAEIQTRVIGS